MPTEVLVMCGACGRPQPAGQGPCIACGALLPEAPLPAPPARPFLEADLGGGRTLHGVDGRLTFRASAYTSPLEVELGPIQDARLRARPLYEALVPAVVLAAVCAAVPSLRAWVGWALFPAALVLGLWRRYVLELRRASGPPVRWLLGVVRRGSRREEYLLAVGGRLSEVLRARPRGPGAGRA